MYIKLYNMVRAHNKGVNLTSKLRGSGHGCRYFDPKPLHFGRKLQIEQACVSIPKIEAAEANAEFDRLLDKAKQMNCNVGYLICEFCYDHLQRWPVRHRTGCPTTAQPIGI